TARATLALSITAAPGFTLAASPASLSVRAGTSGASTITVNGQNGFSGAVNLSASGLPSGVTMTFGSSSTTRSSSLTLNASTSAAPGTAAVVITGTSGGLSAKVSLSVTITPPPRFNLGASPASL